MLPIQELLTRYSTWVVGVITAAAAYWLQLPVEQQQELLTAYPWLKQMAPAAGFISFLVARGIKQGGKE
jgi:hypothetical protein